MPARPAFRLCVIGDSFVAAVGDPTVLGWTGRVAEAAIHGGADVTLYALGIRRDTSLDIRARWLEEASRRLRPGMDGRIIFAFGLNDCCPDDATGERRVEEEASVEALDAILTASHARWPTLMIGPAPIDDDVVRARAEALDARYAAHCLARGWAYLSVLHRLRASSDWTIEAAANDGAHPSAGGYAALAELVSEWPDWRAWLGERG